MIMIDLRKFSAMALVLALAAGCSTATKDTSGMGTAGTSTTSQGVSESDSGVQAERLSAEELERQRLLKEQQERTAEEATLREIRVFYFDFDSNVLKPEAHLPLQAHAKYLRENANVRVVLNGYTDERGTKEYNLALGERRAQSVQRFLVVNGVPVNRIEVVSYGEEFPVDPGHDEAAWAKNRRVELQYR